MCPRWEGGQTVIIIRLPEISDGTDVFPIMNILVISEEQKAAVRGLWHQPHSQKKQPVWSPAAIWRLLVINVCIVC